MFESLENRVLMAKIELIQGVLFLRGNSEDNFLSVTTSPLSEELAAQYGISGEIVKMFQKSKVKEIRMLGKGGVDTLAIFAQQNGTAPKAQLLGGAGNDGVTGSTGKDTIVGGPGDDNCDGGAGNDLIKGNGGADTVRGRAGNDTVIGGKGIDLFFGDEGNDIFKAQDNKADNLVGGSGDDTAYVDFTNEPFHVLNSLDGLGTEGEIEEVITG